MTQIPLISPEYPENNNDFPIFYNKPSRLFRECTVDGFSTRYCYNHEGEVGCEERSYNWSHLIRRHVLF